MGQAGPARADPPPARWFTLRDGTRILVRPILAQDKERLRAGFAGLSAESRHRRFLSAMNALSEEQVRYLTEIDYADHMAWVALDPSQPAQPGLGIARYIRLPEDPATAEAAVTVTDEHQGRGIGTILLEVLAESALQHGIRRFRGYVLAGNTTMVELLHGLGASVAHEGHLLRVEVPLPASPGELPDTATGRIFRSLAEHPLPLVQPPAQGGPD